MSVEKLYCAVASSRRLTEQLEDCASGAAEARTLTYPVVTPALSALEQLGSGVLVAHCDTFRGHRRLRERLQRLAKRSASPYWIWGVTDNHDARLEAGLLRSGFDDVSALRDYDRALWQEKARSALRRVRSIGRPDLEFGPVLLYLSSRMAMVDGRAMRLRPASIQVLQALLACPGQVLTPDHICDGIARTGVARPSVSAIKVRVSRLRRELGSARWVVQSEGNGYRIGLPPSRR